MANSSHSPCLLFDQTACGRVILRGAGTGSTLEALCVNDMRSLTAGFCRPSPLCYPDGGTVDVPVFFRLDREEYLMLTSPAQASKDTAWILTHRQGVLQAEDVSEDTVHFALLGESADTVLQAAGCSQKVPVPARAFVRGAMLAGTGCMLCRLSRFGIPGIELITTREEAAPLRDALLKAGAEEQNTDALERLRVLRGIPAYGAELSDAVTPLEGGLRALVHMEHDFIGHGALSKPATNHLVGLLPQSDVPVGRFYPVMTRPGHDVGYVTSSVRADSKTCAMAIILSAYADHPSLLIETESEVITALVVQLPFIKEYS